MADPDEGVFCGQLKNSESLVVLDELLHLSTDKRRELVCLIEKYPELFGDMPSRMAWVEHDICVGEAQSIKQRFY